MKVPQLSTDSFVDIISNTTGMVIILTLLSTILAQVIGRELDDKRALEKKLTDEKSLLIEKKRSLLAELEKQRRENKELQSSVSGLERQWMEKLKKLEDIRADLEALKEKIKELERLSPEDRPKYEKELFEIQKELERRRAELDKETLAQLERDLEELRKEDADLAKEIELARAELKERDVQLAKLQKEIKELRETLKELQEQVAKLEAQKAPVIYVDPPRDLEAGASASAPLWVECLSIDGEPRLRIVSGRNYRDENGTYIPKNDGDPLESLANNEAPLNEMDFSGKDSGRPRHLYALVRPEGVGAFRKLSEWAHGKGIRLEWDPLPTGDTLNLRGR